MQFQLIEGEQGQGDLLQDTGAYQAGFTQLVAIAGIALTDWPLSNEETHSGTHVIQLPIGTLYVDANGQYWFKAVPSLDHTQSDSLQQSPLELSFTNDLGHIADTTLVITINDGQNPAANFNQEFYELADEQIGETQLTVTVNMGSDPLLQESIRLDLASIREQLPSLTSQGSPLQWPEQLTEAGEIVVYNLTGERVFTIALTEIQLIDGGDLAVQIAVTQHHPLDHSEQETLSFPVAIAGSDSDGDWTYSQTTVLVADDAPTVDPIHQQLLEQQDGQFISGNLLEHADFGSDGPAASGGLAMAATVMAITGESLAAYPAYDSGAYAGFHPLPVNYGWLYLHPDGRYLYKSEDNLDHGRIEQTLHEFIPFIIQDGDGDTAESNLSITIIDGEPAHIETVSAELTEAALQDDGQALATRTVALIEVQRGSDHLDPHSFQFDSELIAKSIAQLHLTAMGVPVAGEQMHMEGNRLTLLDDNGNPTLLLQLGNPNGAADGDLWIPVTIDSLLPLDQPFASDHLQIPISVVGRDSDNDPVRGELLLTIRDGLEPHADAVQVTLMDAAEGNSSSALAVFKVNHGSDPINEHSFRLNSKQIRQAIAELNLTSDGVAISGEHYELGDNSLLLFNEAQQLILRISLGETLIDEQGDLWGPVKITTYAPLDHDADAIEFPIHVLGKDNDNDLIAVDIKVTIIDPPLQTTDGTLQLQDPADHPDPADEFSTVDETEVIFHQGSDPILSEQIEFDLEAIHQALFKLNLHACGVRVSGSKYVLDGDVLTIMDSHLNPVLELVLGTPITKADGDVSVTVQATTLAPLDHEHDSLSLPIYVRTLDRDDDVVQAQVDIHIQDLNPIAENVTNHLIEGTQVSGNLLLNTQLGESYSPGLVSVAGYLLADQVPLTEGAFAGYIELALDYGTLYVDLNGNYRFIAGEDLPHTAPHEPDLQAAIPFTVADCDDDRDTAHLLLTIADGVSPSATVVIAELTESASEATSSESNQTSVTVSLTAGSDGIDLDSIRFDINAIHDAIFALNLYSCGVRVSGSKYTLDGNTLTIFDTHLTPILQAELGQPYHTTDGAAFPVTLTSLGPLDHDATELQLPIFIQAQDNDGDFVQAEVALTVLDTQPVAHSVSTDLVETKNGATATGNLLINTDFGADGPAAGGAIDTINGLSLSQLPILTEGTYSGWVEILVSHGHLYVKPNGDFEFIARDNLFHGAEFDQPLQFSVPFTVQDCDHDRDHSALHITITDGQEPTADIVEAYVADEGTADQVEIRIARGSDEVSPESVQFDVAATSAAIAVLGLTASGVPITGYHYQLDDDRFTLLDDQSRPILRATLGTAISLESPLVEENGDLLIPVLVESLQAIDHQNDTLSIPFFVRAQDSDNDAVQAQVSVWVADAEPDSQDVLVDIEEQQGGNRLSGNLLQESGLGADGAGALISVAGVVLAEQPLVSAGEFAGYVEVPIIDGVLYLQPDGSYQLVIADSLDHGNPEEIRTTSVPFTLVDFDGDHAGANLTINIVDGAVPNAEVTHLCVSENGPVVTGELLVERGSDPLDAAGFKFDLEATATALAALGLTSSGVAVDGSQLQLQNSTLIIQDANGIDIIQVILADPNAVNGDLRFPIIVAPLKALDAADGAVLPVFISGSDQDNDPVLAQINIELKDGSPINIGGPITAEVVEQEGGSSVSGNLLENIDFGADGGGALTNINGVDLTTLTPISGGPFNGFFEVPLSNGTLYVTPEGEYQLLLDDDQDHGNPEQPLIFDVPFTATDIDGDNIESSLVITLNDGAPASAAPVAVSLSDAGGSEQVDWVIDRGSDSLDPTSVAFDTDAIAAALANLGLSSNGVAIDGSNLSQSSNGLIIEDNDGNPILSVSLGAAVADNDGNLSFPVTVTTLAPLDHDADSLSLPIYLSAQDRDNDPVNGQVTVTITDVEPSAVDVAVTLTETEGGIISPEGDLLANSEVGADGGATVTEVNGVVLADETPISDPTSPFNGYIAVPLSQAAGVLYVQPSGAYLLQLDDDQFHGTPTDTDLLFDVPFTLSDFDGDTQAANLSVTYQDGAPLSINTTSLLVDEDAQLSDSSFITIERGSDALAINAVDFDLTETLLALESDLPLGISAALDPDATLITNNTMTLFDVNGDPLLSVTIGSVALDGNGNATVPIDVVLFGGFEHNSEPVTVPVVLSARDGDNDVAMALVPIQIFDGEPTLPATVLADVIEGQVGNEVDLFANADFELDGGQLTSVNGIPLSNANLITDANDPNNGFHEIATQYGTVYVQEDGRYRYSANQDIDHGLVESLSEQVSVTATDNDGDAVSVLLTQAVLDGAPPISAGVAGSVVVDESDGQTATAQTLGFYRGSDPITSVQFNANATVTAIAAAFANGLPSSNGSALDLDNYLLNSSGTEFILRNEVGETALVLNLTNVTVDMNGDWDLQISAIAVQGLDHELLDLIDLPIIVTAYDQDNDTVDQQVNVVVLDAEPEPNPDAYTLIEGSTDGSDLTFTSLLVNDNLGADGAAIDAIRIDGSLLADPQMGTVVFSLGNNALLIDTVAGQLTVRPDGSWNFSADANQYHPSDIPIELPFEYQLLDGDGDASDWTPVQLTIVDGAVRPGGEQLEQLLTEPDLDGSPTYPASISNSVVLNDLGSDNLDFNSFATTADLQQLITELETEIFSSGNPVTAMVTGTSILLTDTVSHVDVLSIDYSLADVAGSPTVTIMTTLSGPLNHQSIHDTVNGFVTLDGDNIVFALPFQVQDSDGDALQAPILLSTTIVDGLAPTITQQVIPQLNEEDLATAVSISEVGSVDIGVNSDLLNINSFAFNDIGHSALTSNGELLVYSLDPMDSSGQTLLAYVNGELALKVELQTPLDDNSNTVVNYQVSQFLPLDQPNDGSNELTASFVLSVTDIDGDQTVGTISATFIDGPDNQLMVTVLDQQITEQNIGEAPIELVGGQTNSETGVGPDIQITTGSDPVNQIEFDLIAGQILTGITHDSQPIQWFNVAGEWQGWSMDGNSQDTLILTLSSPSQLDPTLSLAPNTTTTVNYEIIWHSFIDHPNPADSLSLQFPLTITDADGDSISDSVTLIVLDGQNPNATLGSDSGAVIDVNQGQTSTVNGELNVTQGSDFIRYEVDEAQLTSNLNGLTSDGLALSVMASENDYLVTRPNGNGGTETVMRISFDGAGGYQVVLSDNLDHLNAQEQQISFELPIRVIDSDDDATTVLAPITIIDTNPTAENDQLTAAEGMLEGSTINGTMGTGLLSNDELGSDGDRAQINQITFGGNTYTLTNGTVMVTTLFGPLTVNADGSYAFTADSTIDHSGTLLQSLVVGYQVVDGDGDTADAEFTITIRDAEPALIVNGGQELEDSDAIPITISIDLGDVDQNESIQNLMIEAPPLIAGNPLGSPDIVAGVVQLNGVTLIADVNGQLPIPIGDTVTIVNADGTTTITVPNLTFVPSSDYANNSNNGPLQLDVSVDVSSDQDTLVTLTGSVDISVLAVADIPTWNDVDLNMEEDVATKLFVAFDNPNGIEAQLNDDDNSEQLSYRIDSIPSGFSVFLNGIAIAEGTELSEAQLDDVTVLADEHDAGQYTLGITAIATEQGANGDISVKVAETPANITINVTPIVDKPIIEFAVAGGGGNDRTVKIDEDSVVFFGDYFNFGSPDPNEINYLRVQEIDTNGDNGLFCYKDGGNVINLIELVENDTLASLPDGISWDGTGFIIRSDKVDDIAYQPDEDRSSANFDDVRLQFNAISSEITQDGIAPKVGFVTDLSDDTLFLNFQIKGVVDQPELIDGGDFTNQLDDQGNPTGTYLCEGEEDNPLVLSLNIQSSDDDGSEVLNYLIRQIPPGYTIEDDTGNAPTVAGFEDIIYEGQVVTVPIYQITPAQMAAGTFSISPPEDFSGVVDLLVTTQVTELDGDNGSFDNPLVWTLIPAIDTADTSDSINGTEVETDDDGNYLSGGAAIVSKADWLADIDGSESISDAAINAAAGFAIQYQGMLFSSISSLASLINGDATAVNDLLQSGDLVLVPVLDNGNSDLVIDPDAPPPVNGTHVTLSLTITDSQNGLTTTSNTARDISLNVDWQGEVDGEGNSNIGANSESSGLVGPDAVIASDGGILDLGTLVSFISTDSDNSEVVERYRLELDPSINWSLTNSAGVDIGTNIGGGVFLLEQSSLDNVLLQGHSNGTFGISVVALVSDLGDQEIRQVDFSAELTNTVALGGGDGDGQVSDAPFEPLFLNPIVGSEDGQDPDGNTDPASFAGNVDLNAHGDSNDIVSYRVDSADLPSGAVLSGNVTEIWGPNGETIGYVVTKEDLESVSIELANHQTGAYSIPVTVVISDPDSGAVYLTDDDTLPVTELVLEVTAVADGVTISVDGQGEETEDASDDDRFPLGLTLSAIDSDGSEMVTEIILTPQAGLALFGDGLIQTANGYELTRAQNESDSAFQARIDSLTFRSEPGLTHDLDVGVSVTTVDSDTATNSTDSITQSGDFTVFVAPINNRVELTVNDANTDEDNETVISGLTAVLNDSAESLSLVLEGVPIGSFLSVAGQALPYNGSGSWQIPESLIAPDGTIADITIRPPDDLSGQFTLTLVALSKDDEVNDYAEDRADFTLNINPIADDLTLQVDDEIIGSEGQDISVNFDLNTFDLTSRFEDLPEAVVLTFTLDANSDATLNGGDGNPPSITIAGINYPLVLNNGSYQVEITVDGALDNQVLDSIDFNSGDGFGAGTLLISAAAQDSADPLTTDVGTPISSSITLAISPTPDLPQLTVPSDQLSNGSALVLMINASVVNPDINELTIVVDGLNSGSLEDSDGQPVGTNLGGGSVVLTPAELSDLQWVGMDDGNYTIMVTAISDIDGAQAINSDSFNVAIDSTPAPAAFDAGLFVMDDDDDTDGDAALSPSTPTTTLDIGDILQNADEVDQLEALLSNALFEISDQNDNGLVDISVDLDGSNDGLVLTGIDLNSWGVDISDPDAFMDKFIEEYQLRLQNDL
ncbi:MAG: hypothetical protein R3Y10_08810 [Ferrimonas sp.]